MILSDMNAKFNEPNSLPENQERSCYVFSGIDMVLMVQQNAEEQRKMLLKQQLQ